MKRLLFFLFFVPGLFGQYTNDLGTYQYSYSIGNPGLRFQVDSSYIAAKLPDTMYFSLRKGLDNFYFGSLLLNSIYLNYGDSTKFHKILPLDYTHRDSLLQGTLFYYDATSKTLKSTGLSGGIYYDPINKRLGIGMTGPGETLHIVSSDDEQGRWQKSGQSPYGVLGAGSAGVSLGVYSASAGYGFGFLTEGNEKMRLTTAGGLILGNSYLSTDPGAGSMIISGNVGIGLASGIDSMLTVNLGGWFKRGLKVEGRFNAGIFQLPSSSTTTIRSLWSDTSRIYYSRGGSGVTSTLAYLGDVTDSLNWVRDSINQLGASIDIIEDTLVVYRTEINQNATNISINAQTITAHGDSITQHRTAINANATNITLRATINQLGDTSNVLRGLINVNASNITLLVDSIGSHRTEINLNKDNISLRATINQLGDTSNVLRGMINVNASNITLLVDSVGSHRTEINLNKDNISLRATISQLGDTSNILRGLINVNASNITLLVDSVGQHRSEINLNKDNIALRVKKDSIISYINISSEGIDIAGSRITLDGDVVVDGSFTLNGSAIVDTLTSVVINSSTLQTATSGQRVIISGSSNDIKFYDASGYSGGIYGGSGYIWTEGILSLKTGNELRLYGNFNLDFVRLKWNNYTLQLPQTTDIYNLLINGSQGTNGQVIKSNGSNVYWGTDETSSGGITSLNSLTASSQTFATGTSGTAPNWSSATSTHTLNIPMAATASVTAGLLSKTQYDDFNSRVTSSTFTTHTGDGGAHGATASNVINTIVQRDGTGDFAAGIITATTFIGSLSGNASTVTNGVYTTGSYSDPSWLTLSISKITGLQTALDGKANTSGTYSGLSVGSATEATNAYHLYDSYGTLLFEADDFGASLNTSGNNILLKNVGGQTLSTITAPYATNAGNASTVTNGVYTTGSYSNPSWITALAETKVLPSQTSNANKVLTTNGTASSWNLIGSSNMSTSLISGTFSHMTDIIWDAGVLKYKWRSITFTNGVITSYSAESAWTTVPSI